MALLHKILWGARIFFFVTVVVLFLLRWFMQVPLPEEWLTLNIGDTLLQAQQKIPDLRHDANDPYMDANQYADSNRIDHFGEWFSVFLEVTFDVDGKAKRIRVESKNSLSGFFDRRRLSCSDDPANSCNSLRDLWIW